MSIPGNSRSRCAAITCSIGTNRVSSASGRNRGSTGGTFTRAKRSSPVLRVAHEHREVQREVRDVRERVRRVDRERREHREDLGLEHLGELGAVVGGRDRPSSRSGCRRPRGRARSPCVNVAAWRAQSSSAYARTARSCSPESRPSGERVRMPASNCSWRPGDAHLEVLVEVLGEDGEELGPLEQRQLRVLGEREHAGVEVEPRELAVQEPRRDPAPNPRRRRRARSAPGRREAPEVPSATDPSYR